MPTLIFIVIAYLIGSVSFAVVTSKIAGLPDPHTYGSGNPGATNVLRSGSKAAALGTLLGDAAKGWLAVWLALRYAPVYGAGTGAIAGTALAVFVGHLFPVFHGFKGGKGVATALGILLALAAQLGLGVLLVWAITFAISRISSLSGLVAAAFAPALTVFFFGFGSVALAVTGMSILLFWRHRGNIAKLRAGTEGRVGSKRG